MTKKIIILVLLIAIKGGTVAATDFYVSAQGNDASSGTSVDRAWRTIQAVNSRDFGPGDRVFFEGGATFTGSVYLGSRDGGTAEQPVVLTSYGNGRAILSGGSDNGFLAYNTAGIAIRNLEFRGAGVDNNFGSGILFYTDLGSGQKLDYVEVDGVEVSGFRKGGVVLGSWNSSLPGYRQVGIRNSAIHHNGHGGIISYGWGPNQNFAFQYAHEDFQISGNEVFSNFGDPAELYSPTGSGIYTSHVDGAMVQFNHVFNNGGINSQNSGGPVGIWAVHARNVVMEYNISHNNKTGGTQDGGGYDLDGGVSDSVMQYNYSYMNEGAGFGLFQFSGAAPNRNNIIRYNISYNDGRANQGHGGITIWAEDGNGIDNATFHGNTIVSEPSSKGDPIAVSIVSDPSRFQNLKFVNNIFLTMGSVPILWVAGSTSNLEINFLGNLYWTADGDSMFLEGNQFYFDLASWIAGSGQEIYAGVAIGIDADPLLQNPFQPTLATEPGRLATLDGFRSAPGSPVIDRGLSLIDLFGINPGSYDFYGETLPQGPALDIGAEESPVVSSEPENQSPVFLNDPLSGGTTPADSPYGNSLAGTATDPDGDQLTYEKVSGPAWLIVEPDGNMSGTPGSDFSGVNEFVVRVNDPGGGGDEAILQIVVEVQNELSPPQPPQGLRATALRKRRIRLDWNPGSDDSAGFLLERAQEGTPWMLLASLGPEAGDHMDRHLHQGETYFYRLRAFNEAGYSRYSEIVSAIATNR